MKKPASFHLLILLLVSFGATAQKLELVKDINPNNPNGSPYALSTTATVYDNKLFFSAYDGNKSNLWMTDGTTAGTQMIDLDPSGDCTPEAMIVCNGKLFVTTKDVPIVKLAVTDGTQAGTMILATFDPYLPIAKMVTANNKVFFIAKSNSFGQELWVSDGTVAGTHIVKDSYPGVAGSVVGDLIAYNNNVYYAGRDDMPDRELWVSDGTEAGTHLFADLDPVNDSYPQEFFIFNNKLNFSAATNSVRNLWVTDGTVSGTQMISAFPTGSGDPLHFKGACNGKMFFTARPGVTLYASDGTSGGTTPLKAFDGTSDDFVCYNSAAYFDGQDTGIFRRQLWKTDGTVFGTVNFFGAGSPATFMVGAMAVFNNQLFLAADDSTNGEELWISDGTAGGTYKPAFPGISGVRPLLARTNLFKECNGSLYFTASYNGLGLELWKYSLWPSVVSEVQENNGALRVFPNPATRLLTVQTNRSSGITVRNMLGQVLASMNINNTTSLDISFLNPGLYFISENQTGNVVKFVKQ